MKTIKLMLQKKREDLVREIARRSKASTESGAQDIGDILDSVSEERTRELDMILTDREKRKLAQIESEALGTDIGRIIVSSLSFRPDRPAGTEGGAWRRLGIGFASRRLPPSHPSAS